MALPVEINPLQFGGGGYQISRSVRLRSSASANLTRTPATLTNTTTNTWSGWVKRGQLGGTFGIWAAGQTASTNAVWYFSSADQLTLAQNPGTGVVTYRVSNQVFRDPSAWYHLVLTLDTTNTTAQNRARAWVNGVEITSWATNATITQNQTFFWNSNSAVQAIGSNYGASASQWIDGYVAEVNFIDGQALTPSSFGYTDGNGIWQPTAYTGTYGTNGFYLKFTDNSAATAAAIGKDYSGNGNNWTPNNISVTAGATYDSMIDSPTVGAGASNYPVINPLKVGGTASLLIYNANLRFANTNATWINSRSSIQPKIGGKYYLEFTSSQNWTANNVSYIGLCTPDMSLTNNAADIANIYTTTTSGEVLALAIDRVSNQVTTYRNNTLVATTSISSTADIDIAIASYAASGDINFGQRPFTYTPPTGFAALNTYNLPAATINNGATVMAASTYTGTSATQSIVNSGNNAAAVSFKPDLLWVKQRNGANPNLLSNSIVGSTTYLQSNSTAAEGTSATSVTSFNSNGFTLGADVSGAWNTTSGNYVGWQWQAGQGTTSSNTNGSITSTVSVNAAAGFSVVTFNAGASGAQSFGHGLGVAPKMVILKDRANAVAWNVYHASVCTTTSQYLQLNTAGALASIAGAWGSTLPTSSVVGFGSGTVITANANGVAYCWSEVAGYSKFGSYTGNGSTDGPFVYCGFRPRFVMFKNASAVADWTILDSSRDTYNTETTALFADLSQAEATGYLVDYLANGFKIRNTGAATNGSGNTIVFAAFAENPFTISRAR